MTDRNIKAFDKLITAIAEEDERMPTPEYLELLDELRGFIAVREAAIQIIQRQAEDYEA